MTSTPDGPAIVVTFDGTRYVVRLSDLTGVDALDFRRQLGMRLVEAFTATRDLDTMAGLLWLVRRKREPDLTYHDVASTMTYGNVATTVPSRPEEAEDDPDEVDNDPEP